MRDPIQIFNASLTMLLYGTSAEGIQIWSLSAYRVNLCPSKCLVERGTGEEISIL